MSKEITEETPQYHVKTDGSLCSSVLVDQHEEPSDLDCDCGLNELIKEARLEGAEIVCEAVESEIHELSWDDIAWVNKGMKVIITSAQSARDKLKSL